jgi:hypothetical protein
MLWRTKPPAKRPGMIEPCIPTRATKPPVGPQWIHEIKHDGYRLIARKRDGRVRLFTRNGFDWSDRYPLISEAVAALRALQVVVDGEAVWRDGDGLAIFDKLHSRAYDGEVIVRLRPAQARSYGMYCGDGDSLGWRRRARTARGCDQDHRGVPVGMAVAADRLIRRSTSVWVRCSRDRISLFGRRVGVLVRFSLFERKKPRHVGDMSGAPASRRILWIVAPVRPTYRGSITRA